MPERIVGKPDGGYPGKLQETDGTWVEGIYRMVAYVYGPGEAPPADIDQATAAELRSKYWDSRRRALVVPFTAGRTFEFGPALLQGTTTTTLIHVRPEFSYSAAGPAPRECSCGMLSYRHSTSYHTDAERSVRQQGTPAES